MDSIPATETPLHDCHKCVDYEWELKLPATFSGPNGELCVLHCPDVTKNAAECAAAVERKRQVGDFNFKGAFFCCDVIIGGQIKRASFRDATFNGTASFNSATFNGRADFTFATFNGKTVFCLATFNGTADFTSATFTKQADFVQAIFNDEALFDELSRKREKGKVADDLVELDFRGAIFERPEKIRFQDSNMSKVYFLGADVRNVDFINVIWPPRLHDERIVTKGKYPHVEVLYRQLRQNYEGQRNYPDAWNFYYGEMQMRRKAKWWRRFLPSLETLYWLSSGYGQRPVWAFAWILVLFLFFTWLFRLGGLQLQPPHSGSVTVVHTAGAAFLHFAEVLTFARERTYAPVSPGWGSVGAVQTMVMPIQLALFALAARRKFQR
jgi:uncharacterized protein YjbI with pentapeptide repeats